MKSSKGETYLELQLRAEKIVFEREVMLIPGRKFRVDFLIGKDVVIEIEGATWVKGAHSSGVGILRDMEKSNLLTALGYRLFRFSTKQACDGSAVKFLKDNGII